MENPLTGGYPQKSNGENATGLVTGQE